MKRRRKRQAVSSAYVSGLSAPSFESVEGGDCLSIDGTGRQYLQKAVATTSYDGLRNSKSDSVIVSAEQPCAESA